MTFYDANGNILTKAELKALTNTVTQPVVRQFTANVFEKFDTPGTKGPGRFQKMDRKRFVTGQTVLDTDIDALFATATFTSITPTTGLAAGGTNVTIKGTNLDGCKSGSLSGSNLTNFKVVDQNTITATTAAHAAGATALTLVDDNANVVTGSVFTYA